MHKHCILDSHASPFIIDLSTAMSYLNIRTPYLLLEIKCVINCFLHIPSQLKEKVCLITSKKYVQSKFA